MRWPIWRVAVAERSMEPALHPGDWLLVWRGPSRRERRGRPLRIKPGQIVVARNPRQPDMLLVKRAAWAEPAGWWLDSDNPQAGAVDSARFGVVGPELIEGRVLCCYRRAR
jgi:nickel-type superoxide dismutase maturation protease